MRLREGDANHPPLGSGSAARTLVAVRGFHKFAVRDGLSDADPAGGGQAAGPAQAAAEGAAARPTSRRSSTRPEPPGTTLALRDRALLEVLYGTGARISEAVGLDVDDLDLEQGAVRLRGKGSKERVVPVGSYAARRCRRTWSARGPSWPRSGSADAAVFLNARGGRLSRQSAWAVLGKAAERAGVTADVSPHTLAALVRHPPARRRRRRPGRPGAARPRLGDDHPDLHAGHRRQAARGLRDLASPRARLSIDGRRSPRRSDVSPRIRAVRRSTVASHRSSAGHACIESLVLCTCRRVDDLVGAAHAEIRPT